LRCKKTFLILQKIGKIFDKSKDKFGVDQASACLNIADNIGLSWHLLVQTARQTGPMWFRSA